MICGATEVYMTLWTGKVERVLVLAPVPEAPPKTYTKLDCVGTDECKAGIESRHLA